MVLRKEKERRRRSRREEEEEIRSELTVAGSSNGLSSSA